MQVRPSFVREAALLLADLAGQPDRNGHVTAAGFLEALATNLDEPASNSGQGELTGTLWQNYAPFLAQMEDVQPTPPSIDDALSAYTQRLSFGAQYEGLYWPVDMEV